MPGAQGAVDDGVDDRGGDDGSGGGADRELCPRPSPAFGRDQPENERGQTRRSDEQARASAGHDAPPRLAPTQKPREYSGQPDPDDRDREAVGDDADEGGEQVAEVAAGDDGGDRDDEGEADDGDRSDRRFTNVAPPVRQVTSPDALGLHRRFGPQGRLRGDVAQW